jgi:archaellum component FlaC
MALYVITDGNKNYIRRDIDGKYVAARSRALADEFLEKWKAEKVLKNNLTPKKRKLYRVVEEDVGFTVVKKPEQDQAEKPKEEKKPEQLLLSPQIEELRKKIEGVKKFIDDAENRRSELSDLLSNTDKEITDIQHYIEFSDINGEDIASTYNMLKTRLKNRRQIKNELSVLRQLAECKMDASMFGDLLTVISDLDNKTYVPRVLTSLFS